MLDELFNQLAAVPSVPSCKNPREPLQAAPLLVVPSVPPVPSQKTKIKTETQNRYLETHAAVKAFYLSRGRTEADWEKVDNDPAKFNYVWRLMLGMEPNGKPPFIGGRHD